MTKLDKILEDVAKRELSIISLESKSNDIEDFHTISVWRLKAALKEAFLMGEFGGRYNGNGWIDELNKEIK